MIRTSTPTRCAGLALLITAIHAPARADQLCHTVVVPVTPLNFDIEIPIPRFDTAFGTLQLVTVTIDVQAEVLARVENFDATPAQFVLTRGVSAESLAIDGLPFVSASPSTSSMHSLPAFDGILDFGGASGFTLSPITLTSGLVTGSRGDSTVLGLYAGPPGNPGSSGTRVRAVGLSAATGPGNLITSIDHQASFASVTVCYDYAPRITSLCAGDGSGAACPCANPGSAGAGCHNSFGFGARITATGGAAVSADSLTLSAIVPGTTTTLFLQSTDVQAGGQGVAFGDGLRCVGGAVIRLGSGPASAGSAQYPRPGDLSVSQRGLVPPGTTRFYQVWYRNAASFCTPASFNWSNALRIEWGS